MLIKTGKKTRPGLNMIEMSIVLAITAIISAVVLTSDVLLFSRRLDGEAREMVATLRWAREQAASSNSDYCVRFFNDHHNYAVCQGACGCASPVRRRNIISEIDPNSSIVTFSLTFRKFDLVSATNRFGGTATSGTAQVNGGWTLPLEHGDKTRNVRILGLTGYVWAE